MNDTGSQQMGQDWVISVAKTDAHTGGFVVFTVYANDR